MDFDNYKAPLTNRDRVKKNDKRSSYCGSCDANHVWAGLKCGVCGHRADGPKAKMKPGKFKED